MSADEMARQLEDEAWAIPDAWNVVTREIIAGAIEVHRALGLGLLEKLYEEAIVYELGAAGIRYSRQVEIEVPYKTTILRGHRLDLVIEDAIVFELKSIAALLDVHGAQLLSYLRAADMPLGFLMNFNAPVLRDGLKRLCNERWSGFRAA